MDGYIAEVRIFGGNFAPRSWAFCQGQLLSIALYTPLFALVGTTFGGNGTTTFGLPDFQGRTPFGTGAGPGLPSIILGEMSGSPYQTLLQTQMPAHIHSISASSLAQGAHTERAANNALPVSNYPGIVSGSSAYSTTSDSNMAAYSNISLGNTGGGIPFSTQPPYLGLSFIICLEGIFPSRN